MKQEICRLTQTKRVNDIGSMEAERIMNNTEESRGVPIRAYKFIPSGFRKAIKYQHIAG